MEVDTAPEWGQVVKFGQSFSLTNSYTGWSMSGGRAGESDFTEFVKGDGAERFTVPGHMTPRQAVTYLGVYTTGHGRGIGVGHDVARQKMRAALGL